MLTAMRKSKKELSSNGWALWQEFSKGHRNITRIHGKYHLASIQMLKANLTIMNNRNDWLYSICSNHTKEARSYFIDSQRRTIKWAKLLMISEALNIEEFLEMENNGKLRWIWIKISFILAQFQINSWLAY